MSRSADNKVITYIADTKDVRRKLAQLLKANGQLSRGLSKDLAGGYKQVGDSLSKISKQTLKKPKDDMAKLTSTTTKTSRVLQDVDGKLQRVTKSTKTLANGTKRVTTSFQDVKKNTVSLGENLKRLAKRAILTIPVWFALRTAISGTYRTISDGISTIARQDRALQKAKRNIQGTTSEVTANYQKLKQEAQRLSIETGESVENIVTAFQRFATTGLDFETSMRGANASVKTAILLFGETEEIANAVARAYRVLGGRTGDATAQGQELELLLAQVAELWKDNAFEIDEFNGAIERFAPTARVANVSLKETVALLATLQTAGIRGTRAGRLLSTAILQMEKNFDKFSSTLGVNLGTVDSTFERLRMVTKAIEELNETDPIEASQAVSALFRIRGGQSIRALTALSSSLDEAMKKTTSLKQFNEEFEEQNKQVNRLTKQYKNLNVEIGKAFVVGLVGGKDFKDSLQTLVKVLEHSRDGFKELGMSINNTFSILRGQPFISAVWKDAIIDADNYHKNIIKASEKAFKKVADNIKAQLASAFRGDLGVRELQDLFFEMETFGGDYLEISNENMKVLLQRLKEQLSIQKAQTKEQKKQEQSKVQIAKNNQILLDHAIAQLKAQGALTSEILKTESALKSQLNIQDSYEDKLIRQLEIERAINEEKQLQNRFSSTATKLFEIARDDGENIAREISDVLNKNIDFDNFIRRGGKAVDIFKEKFDDVFKAQQMEAYFKGDVVSELSNLRRGAGFELPVEDQAIIKSNREILNRVKTEVSLAQHRLVIEEKITALRQNELQRSQQLINANKVSGKGGFYTETVKSSPSDSGYIRSVSAKTLSSIVKFESGGINININAKNAEDLDKQVDAKFEEIANKVKKDIKDKLLGKQSSNTF